MCTRVYAKERRGSFLGNIKPKVVYIMEFVCKMMHIRKNISLNKEVFEHIQKQHNRYGFDFSKWVEKTYIKTAMNPEKLLEDIERAKLAVVQMEYDYQILKELQASRVLCLTKNEKRWITSELKQRLQSTSNNWESITQFFNVAFDRNFNKAEFRTLAMEIFDEQRLEHPKNA